RQSALTKVILPLVTISSSLFGNLQTSEDEFSKKIISSLLIEDHRGADETCQTALKIFPNSDYLKSLMVRALAQNGRNGEAIRFFKNEFANKDLKDTFGMVESLAWGLLLYERDQNISA